MASVMFITCIFISDTAVDINSSYPLVCLHYLNFAYLSSRTVHFEMAILYQLTHYVAVTTDSDWIFFVQNQTAAPYIITERIK